MENGLQEGRDSDLGVARELQGEEGGAVKGDVRSSTKRGGSRAESLWWGNGRKEASRKVWLEVTDSMERSDPEAGGKDTDG